MQQRLQQKQQKNESCQSTLLCHMSFQNWWHQVQQLQPAFATKAEWMSYERSRNVFSFWKEKATEVMARLVHIAKDDPEQKPLLQLSTPEFPTYICAIA
jgi:hypothetical protein